MTIEDIFKLRDLGEVTKVQFKERIVDVYDVACELVALSNTRGGHLVIGINDKTGQLNSLSYQEVQETTNLLANMASENVIPAILLDVETVEAEGGSVIVAHVKEGLNKPYHDNKGIIWVKNGADKRKVFDNAELAEMMTECGSFTPDEAAVRDATIDDLDEQTLKIYLLNRFESAIIRHDVNVENLRHHSLDELVRFVGKGLTLEKLLRNLHFIRPDGKLTVAAMLLFGKYPQRWLPVFTAKCIRFAGNSVGGNVFIDKVPEYEMEGNLLHQYNTIMAFFRRNLRTVQVEENFNTPGQLEIPYVSLVEFVVNALVHRSLNWKAPIRVFIFDDRVEIHSPGELPGGLTVSDILEGTSMPRNTLLFDNAIHLLPYTGAGSGIPRAMEAKPHVTFLSDDSRHEFIITVRSSDEKEHQVIDEEHQVTVKEHQVTVKEHQVDNEIPKVRAKEHQVDDEIPKVSHKGRKKVEGKQQDIVNFCSVPRTAKEILDRVGIKNNFRARQRYIIPLIEAGVLEMTNPDNPTAWNQKYRKKSINK